MWQYSLMTVNYLIYSEIKYKLRICVRDCGLRVLPM